MDYDVDGGWPHKPSGSPSGCEVWVVLGLAFVGVILLLCCCGGL